MRNALAVFRFLRQSADEGRPAALVTLTDVVGSSARAAGTQMAVAADGSTEGSLSGGCVEAAVIAEALSCLDTRRSRHVRFGLGSPYIDIRLPCGGGMDLLFTPNPPAEALNLVIDMLEARTAVSLAIGRDGALAVDASGDEGWRHDAYHVHHRPDLRLTLLGHGAELVSLARLSAVHGADLRVLTPDVDILTTVRAAGLSAERLRSRNATVNLAADAETAIIFLFHDHDWEGDLIVQALRTRAFYIGAMGSAATHAVRCRTLLDLGASPKDIERVRGPAGLIPATRDPDTLALSVLSQVVLEHGRVWRHDPTTRSSFPILNGDSRQGGRGTPQAAITAPVSA
jgi:xanthine dehydrogenase accessory factor